MAIFALSAAPFAAARAQIQPTEKKEAPEVVIAGEIHGDDARNRFNNAQSKVHAFRFEKDKAYIIEMTGAGSAPIAHIEDSAGNLVAQGNNRVANLSRIRFTAPKDEVYLIFAGAQNGSGKYTLAIKPFAAAAIKPIAIDAPTLQKPSEVKGELANTDPPEQYRDLPGKVYAVDLKKGKTYVIDLISGQFDVYLFLQNADGVLLAQDDDSGGNLNSRIRFQATADGRYRLIASTFSGQVGPYTLRVTEQP